MNYIYTDQNNNQYTVSKNMVSYTPRNKSESSSGMYDGGNAWSRVIDLNTYQEIIELINIVIADSKFHTSSRTMLTAILDTSKDRYILINSDARLKLEFILSGLKE